ncbi:hypothetical protein LOZ61_003540 [Ophidiomyces ophidiicola]|uniref:Uncharacterized protein n=1 Tax=Ophidiomyces ophidiicola TaxID=1387563 RepID=A0ACB8UTD8_9EURO|nr:hypothetical protein LOZ61_003540 [Ophidiomyces ophidiicola]KAI1925548.1 hypothetical protein LOZ60_004062 [Ophidiomyces ophidiicola]KAI1952506.1 hypothetical protein LOZ59_005311 [Ophidiomyces ophidiicola]KAI1969537.1 hypothetical protein LOZ56_004320 [Ophidiomyces ophidiicola]KAI1986416.1 hypothetical protein LOZ51_006008 [Ophidiomyces ophidiicola]
MASQPGPSGSGYQRTNTATEDGPLLSRLSQSPVLNRHSPAMRSSSSSSGRSKTHSTPALLHNLPLSAPTSPPTPAPSPTPHQRGPSWQTGLDDDDLFIRDTASQFSLLGRVDRQRFLAELLNLCDNQILGFVHQLVGPKLRKDPFQYLPNELCFRVLSFIDDPKTLARASQVSRRWHDLLNDDLTWKVLCDKHSYRRLSTYDHPYDTVPPTPSLRSFNPNFNTDLQQLQSGFGSIPDELSSTTSITASSIGRMRPRRRRTRATSYRYHFKHRYMVESAWRKGGRLKTKCIAPDHGVVTSLHLTPKYIVVALDNAKIHVFNPEGELQRTLLGHAMGVWAMVPWDDLLVSGGCDRDVRVWNMATGESVHELRGHTSTVRCLKMSDENTAISGSRDTTIRIWDLAAGVCKHVLIGHQASVRCLEIHGDLIVSGSYDTTARVWSISEGRYLRSLAGHFSQIYAIAFDGTRVATGSLDTSVRIWDAHTGQCHAILQGHTSLVGQLQMRGDTLVTGGSDGSIRVWSLEHLAPIHRLAAHDNSITSLEFDENRIVSGGSDGRVRIWDLATGQLVRELSQPAEAVWRVAFEEEKAVIMATRSGRTVLEVWSFSPPEEEDCERPLSMASTSTIERGYFSSANSIITTVGAASSNAGTASSILQDLEMQDVTNESG